MSLITFILFSLISRTFLDPLDLTDPAESFLITERNYSGEKNSLLPVYSTPSINGIHIPFLIDFSLLSGSFIKRKIREYTFDVVQPDTELPMTYLFSRRGNNDYSHVGGLFSSRFGKLHTSLGADFESKPDIFLGSVTKHNYLVNLKLIAPLTPSLFWFRAEKNTMEKKTLDIKRFTLSGNSVTTSFLSLTYKNIEIPGGEIGFTVSSRTKILASAFGKSIELVSTNLNHEFSPYLIMSAGVTRYLKEFYPVFDLRLKKGWFWTDVFSNTGLIVDSSNFTLDTLITWKRGISVGVYNSLLNLNFELGNGTNLVPVDRPPLDNAWFAHLLLNANAQLKNLIGEFGYSGYALLYNNSGKVFDNIHIISLTTLMAFSARRKKIWFFPGLRLLYLNYPGNFLRADLYIRATFFDVVLLEFKLLNITGQEPPEPMESPRHYTLLLSVVMPD